MRPRAAARAPPPQPKTKPDIFSRNQASLTQAALRGRTGAVGTRAWAPGCWWQERAGIPPSLDPRSCPGLLPWGPHTVGRACDRRPGSEPHIAGALRPQGH